MSDNTTIATFGADNENPTIAIFGAGWLGHKLLGALPGASLYTADIAAQSTQELIADERPDIVINAAGKTGRPNIDWCELHQAETIRSNIIGPLQLARTCQRAGLYLVHLGSGCIFYGNAPNLLDGWREDDFANPQSFYSRTKYSADLILSRMPNIAILRLRMPIDNIPHPRNLITKLASYKQVIEATNSVTVVQDFIQVARTLISLRATGIFHLTNPGIISHREIIRLYTEIVDPDYSCEFIRPGELQSRGIVTAARSNCRLHDTRLSHFSISMRPVREAVADTLRKYAENSRVIT